jgi:hypothetical protein
MLSDRLLHSKSSLKEIALNLLRDFNALNIVPAIAKDCQVGGYAINISVGKLDQG